MKDETEDTIADSEDIQNFGSCLRVEHLPSMCGALDSVFRSLKTNQSANQPTNRPTSQPANQSTSEGSSKGLTGTIIPVVLNLPNA